MGKESTQPEDRARETDLRHANLLVAADALVRAALRNHNGSVVIPVEAWASFEQAVESNGAAGGGVDYVRSKRQSEHDHSTWFEVGDVTGRRLHAKEFKVRLPKWAKNKFGWRLTHQPTGRTKDLPPDASGGVTRYTAELYAVEFGRACASLPKTGS